MGDRGRTGPSFLRAVIAAVLANIAGYRSFRDGVGAKGVLAVTGPIAYTRAIHPIRDRHPHRLVAFEALGLRYRAADGLHLADTAAGRHYAQLHRPVVRRGPLETALAEALLPPPSGCGRAFWPGAAAGLDRPGRLPYLAGARV